MTLCTACGHELAIGDYPFCPHGSIFEVNARRFSEPILVFESLTHPGEVSMPATNSEPCPEGYRPRLLTNLQEADQFIRAYNQHERAKLVEDREAERGYWDQVTRARRERILSRPLVYPDGTVVHMTARGRALFEEVKRFVDERRARRYRGDPDPHAHFQVLSYDSGNRPSHASKAANGDWRERKG
jgi:hypothetical protein